MQFALEKLDVSDPANVENWHERFEYFTATNRGIKDDNKEAWYLAHVGKDAYNLLKDLAYPESLSTKKVADFKALLLAHLRPATFETTERAKFHTLTRQSGQSFRNFLLELRRQVSRCNFGSELSTQLRDRIVAGVNDKELQRRLLREAGLTFNKAKQILESADDVENATTVKADVLATAAATNATKRGDIPMRGKGDGRGATNKKARRSPSAHAILAGAITIEETANFDKPSVITATKSDTSRKFAEHVNRQLRQARWQRSRSPIRRKTTQRWRSASRASTSTTASRFEVVLLTSSWIRAALSPSWHVTLSRRGFRADYQYDRPLPALRASRVTIFE